MSLCIINGRGGEMEREEVVWMVKGWLVENMGRGRWLNRGAGEVRWTCLVLEKEAEVDICGWLACTL